jgi:hypothetical protein
MTALPAQPRKYQFTPLFAAGRSVAAGAHVLTDGEVEALRAAARAEGEAAGRAAAEAATGRAHAEALSALAAGLPKLKAELDAGLAAIEEAAAALALDIGRALADRAIAAAPTEALRPTLERCFQRIAGDARLAVTVHQTMVDQVTAAIEDIARTNGFAGHVRVSAGAASPADLHAEWGEGGLERRLAEIDGEIGRAFAARGVRPRPALDREETD